MQRPVPSRVGLEILLVDDDDDTTAMLSLILRRDGHNTVRCDQLDTAATLLSARCFHLAVIDLSLPDGTGIEAAKLARRRIPEPYLVALTGWSDGALLESARAVFDVVLTKPVYPDDLRGVIDAAWERADLRS
jgi:DNA-binding response OmpR family regulator